MLIRRARDSQGEVRPEERQRDSWLTRPTRLHRTDPSHNRWRHIAEAKEIIYGAVGLAASLRRRLALLPPRLSLRGRLWIRSSTWCGRRPRHGEVREGRWFGDSIGAPPQASPPPPRGRPLFSLVTASSAAGLEHDERPQPASWASAAPRRALRPVFEVLALVLAASVMGAIAFAKGRPAGRRRPDGQGGRSRQGVRRV